jgi:hypothetical protein
VDELGKALGGLLAHALRRAVGRDEAGMRGFQLAQLPLEAVVVLVRDLRTVQDVVEPLVPADLVAELLDPTGGLVAAGGLVAGPNSRAPG